MSDFGFANEVDVDALNSLAEGLVQIMHNTADGMYPVANQTVGSVRSSFQQSYNIPSDAVAMVNSIQVGDDYVLRPNESLEFVVEAGKKG